MVSLESWKKTMYLFCSANVFLPHRLKSGLEKDPIGSPAFKSRFEIILQEKPFTAQGWEDEFDTSFDEDEEVHEHLQAIYDYLFLGGPVP